jgi:hypothetical protein
MPEYGGSRIQEDLQMGKCHIEAHPYKQGKNNQQLVLFRGVEQVEQTIGGFDNFPRLGFDVIWRKLSITMPTP